MKKGITFGVFDVFHLGHLNMLKNARKYCDYLTVAVHDDKLNTKGVKFLYTLEQRMEIIDSIRFVDCVVSYERVDMTLSKTDFDIFLYGPDQCHEFFKKAFKYCDEMKRERQILERTKGISSNLFRAIVDSKQI